MNKDEIAGLVERLMSKVFGNLTPGAIDHADLDGMAFLVEDAADALTTLSARVETLEATNARHETAWNDMLALLEDAPEINPSNYDHDQVCLLNTQMIQAWNLATEMHSGQTVKGGSNG